MKETMLYICEICGEEYNERKEAEDCEASHIKPKRLAKMKFRPYKIEKGTFSPKVEGRYPEWIDIEMQDGNTVTYYRLRSAD